MVKVVAKNFIKEEKIEDVLKVAKELVELTVAKDKGCIKYEMYQDLKDKTILTMIEEWESMECLQKHMQSEHFKKLVPMMGEYSKKQGETNIYTKVV
ncbi:antibiotic biosynthesis monooxygenase [Clostridium acetobutylicum]|nr:antibiotic biosynthesis monooxygenase [Clostridium acetobutylicum]